MAYQDHIRTNAAFTHNGFDDQERNLTFVKTNLKFETQILCLQFKAVSLSSSSTTYHVILTA